MRRPLSNAFDDDAARPYFLWDESTTVGEFRREIAATENASRSARVGKLMREARDTDVWAFVTVAEVVAHYDAIRPFLGRRRAFWDYLIGAWKAHGIVG